MSILALLAPDFLLIVVGFVLRRAFACPDDFWVGLEKVVYFVLFPASIAKWRRCSPRCRGADVVHPRVAHGR